MLTQCTISTERILLAIAHPSLEHRGGSTETIYLNHKSNFPGCHFLITVPRYCLSRNSYMTFISTSSFFFLLCMFSCVYDTFCQKMPSNAKCNRIVNAIRANAIPSEREIFYCVVNFESLEICTIRALPFCGIETIGHAIWTIHITHIHIKIFISDFDSISILMRLTKILHYLFLWSNISAGKAEKGQRFNSVVKKMKSIYSSIIQYLKFNI